MLRLFVYIYENALVAELVDALDLGSSGVTRESSSLSSRTIFNQKDFYEGINRIYPRVGNHTKNSDSVLQY